YMDRSIDGNMKRTKWRHLATDQISLTAAVLYACALVAGGMALLVLGANWLTVGVGLVGIFSYLVLYSITKRRTVHGTLVGCISGATPLVAGYTAVTNQLNTACVLLFALMVFWQLAHFYSIGLYRLKDYSAAKLPIMPVVRGPQLTKQLIGLNIVGFGVCVSLLTTLHYAG